MCVYIYMIVFISQIGVPCK